MTPVSPGKDQRDPLAARPPCPLHGRPALPAVVGVLFSVCGAGFSGSVGAQPSAPDDVQAGPSSAFEQPTPADTELELEDVEVRGEKLEGAQSRVASSVQVLTREAIEAASMDDLYDAIARTANVNPDFADLGREGGFAIRGISNTGVSDQSFSSSTPLASVYVDGVPLSVAGARGGPLELWDVESIEFFRGPQSTQRGQGALAGAILVNTRDPEPVIDLRARLRRGSDGYIQRAVALGGPVNERLGLRVVALTEMSDGADYNVTRQEPAAFRERHNLRAKLGWLAREPSEATAVLSVTRSDHVFGQAQLAGDPRARQTVANDPEQVETSTDLLSFRADLPIDAHWAVAAITGRGRTRLSQLDDFNASAEDDGTILNAADDDSFTQELRLAASEQVLLGRPIRGLVGYYTSRLESDSALRVEDGAVASAGPLALYLDTQVDVAQQRRGHALFGDLEWTILPRWTLLAGVRVDRESLDYRYVSNNDIALSRDGPAVVGDVVGDLVGPLVGLPEDGEGRGGSRSDAWLPKLGLRYQWSEQTTVGVVVQRAYRAGGLSVNFVRGSFRPFAPEYTLTTELFTRITLLKNRLRLRANVFNTDWTDQQVSVQLSDDPNDTQTENAGASQLYGGELEIDARLRWNLEAFASVGWVRTEFLRFESTAGDFSGNEFPSAPRRQGTVGLQYGGPALGLQAQLDLSYVDAQFRQADNNPEQRSDAYALLNGRIAWRFARAEVYVAGRNLLDRFYLTQRAFGRFRAGDPRTLFAGIDVAFD